LLINPASQKAVVAMAVELVPTAFVVEVVAFVALVALVALVAVAALPVQEPELPVTFPVTFPVTLPVTFPVTLPVILAVTPAGKEALVPVRLPIKVPPVLSSFVAEETPTAVNSASKTAGSAGEEPRSAVKFVDLA
jgi:hypothetical protein